MTSDLVTVLWWLNLSSKRLKLIKRTEKCLIMSFRKWFPAETFPAVSRVSAEWRTPSCLWLIWMCFSLTMELSKQQMMFSFVLILPALLFLPQGGKTERVMCFLNNTQTHILTAGADESSWRWWSRRRINYPPPGGSRWRAAASLRHLGSSWMKATQRAAPGRAAAHRRGSLELVPDKQLWRGDNNKQKQPVC